MNDLFAEPRFVAGIGEFNSANFFEAHEIWEELWNDLLDDEKRACQSLIQIAAGYHKESIGNSLGARKLLERGLRGLAPLLPSRAWATEFRRHVAADLETLKRGAPRLSGSRPSLPSVSRSQIG